MKGTYTNVYFLQDLRFFKMFKLEQFENFWEAMNHPKLGLSKIQLDYLKFN